MTGKFEQFRGGNPHENQSSAQEGARQKLFSEEKAKLQGYRTFPNNPRAADLLAKDILGQTTEEEKAELQGYRTFPNNPRAADLLAKDILGQTTEEEKAELAKYFER